MKEEGRMLSKRASEAKCRHKLEEAGEGAEPSRMSDKLSY